MAEIFGIVIGAIVSIGKIIYDEFHKAGKYATSCGQHKHDKEDDTPRPESLSDDEEPAKVTLGRNTVRRLIKKLIED